MSTASAMTSRKKRTKWTRALAKKWAKLCHLWPIKNSKMMTSPIIWRILKG